MKTIDVLREARALISAPERWTQFALARDQFGRKVEFASKDAASWCAAAAIFVVCEKAVIKHGICDTATALVEKAVGRDIVFWNNDPQTRHSHILAGFDTAIANCEASC